MTDTALNPVDTGAPAATGTAHPLRSLVHVGPTGIVVGVGLSAVIWWLVRSFAPDASVAAAALALTMTAPVVLARRRPVLAAGAVLVGAMLNGLLFDDLVRCGAALPALLYIAFSVGSFADADRRGWTGRGVGLGLALAAVMAQYLGDPALNADLGFLAFGPPLVVLAWAAGLGVRRVRARRAR